METGEPRSVMGVVIAFTWSITVGALIMALIGWFRWQLVLVVAVFLCFGLMRFMPRVASPTISRIYWIAALSIAVGSSAFNSLFPSEELITGRDGGTYLATAGWLAAEETLLIEARVDPFDEIEGLDFAAAGFFDVRSDGILTPQFQHSFPALSAFVYQFGGIEPALRVNAVLGGVALLLVFGFASLLMRPGVALAVEAALALNLVFVYYSRAPFSEIMALLFMFGGLWVLWRAQEMGLPSGGLSAGLIIGTVVLVRLDGLVLLIPVLGFALLRRQWESEKSFWSHFLAGLLAIVALAGVDIVTVDPTYLGIHKGQVMSIMIALVLVTAGALFSAQIPQTLVSSLRRHRKVIGNLVVAVLLSAALFVLAVRPHIQQAVGEAYGVAEIQEAEGLAVEPGRTYAEASAIWLLWYTGPIVAFAAFGWAWLFRSTILRSFSLTFPFVGILSTYTILYIWRPSINPDHIWAARRFLPVVIPGLLVCAGWLVELLWRHAADRPATARTVAVVLALILVLGPLPTLLPLASLHQYEGLADDFLALCDEIDDDAVVVLDGADIGFRLAQSFRSYCGLPAAIATNDSVFLELADRAAVAGLDLVLVRPAGIGEDEASLREEYLRLETTLTRPPSGVKSAAIYIAIEEIGRSEPESRP